MRLAALLLIALLNAACSHATVAVSNGAPAVAATTVVAGSIGASMIASGGAAVALVLAIGVAEYVNNPQPFPNPTSLISMNTPPVPEMATGRLINEQDCSQPVDFSRGNLRCK
jgi:hypothetical protein